MKKLSSRIIVAESASEDIKSMEKNINTQENYFMVVRLKIKYNLRDLINTEV